MRTKTSWRVICVARDRISSRSGNTSKTRRTDPGAAIDVFVLCAHPHFFCCSCIPHILFHSLQLGLVLMICASSHVFVSLLFDKDTKLVIQWQYNGIRIPHDLFTTSQLIGWFLSRMYNRRQSWVAHSLLPPGLNVPDGRLPDDEPKHCAWPENVQFNTQARLYCLLRCCWA